MQAAPIPPDEDLRIATLRQLIILDTPPERRFDNITRVARSFFRVPMALVSLVDSDRQWFKSTCGLKAQETERTLSFCAHAILHYRPLIIPDASLDERFQDNPLVIGEPFIRFYAGAPLTMPNGMNVGTLCLIDTVPRTLTDAELRMLSDLAQLVTVELQRPSDKRYED